MYDKKNYNILLNLIFYNSFYYFYCLLIYQYEYNIINSIFNKINRKNYSSINNLIKPVKNNYKFLDILNFLKKRNRFKMFIKYNYSKIKRVLIYFFQAILKQLHFLIHNLKSYFKTQFGYFIINPIFFFILNKKYNLIIYYFYLMIKYSKSIILYINKKLFK
jgi:hypothetical protein